MGALHRLGASLFVTAALAAGASAGRADELLMMPFSCTVVAGQPVLQPSAQEAYRILGPREQRIFRACSPVNPGVCRQWTLHRFDLECGGVRVPWAAVATAAERPWNRRAWLEDGRVRLRMAPWWNMAPGDPCAREPMYGDRWQFDRLARYCAERRAMVAPSTVEMPFGFAPMLGTGGEIVTAAGPLPGSPAGGVPQISSGPAHPPAPRAEAPAKPKPELAQRDAAPKEAPAKSKPARQAELPPPSSPPAASVSAPAPSPATPAQPKIINRVEPQPAVPPPAPSEVTPPPPATATVPPAAAAPPAPAAPKIINRVEPQPEAPVRAPNPEAVPPPSDGAGKFAAHVPTRPSEPPAPVGSPPGAAAGRDQLIPVTLLGAIGGPSTAALGAFAALAALVLMTFAWQRRRERSQFAGMAARDFAAVSLGAGGRGGDAPAPRSLVVANSPPPARDQQSLSPGRALAGLGNAIPRTRAEALQVLGMGVTADAPDAAIKRIVDGLRQSWHPDHAKDTEDRRMRELRLKQINAAWDIIHGKRAEA